MSASYYESVARVALVRVPAAEDCSLLGLPDLLHEVGHWIYYRYLADFNDFATSLVDPFFAAQAIQLPTGIAAQPHAEKMGFLSEQWHGPWLREFASDLFSTWVIGAPYALQHVRLCFSRSANPFADQGSHPADAARFAAIRALLVRCGPAGAAELAIAEPPWSAYVAHLSAAGVAEGADYATRYPVTLIDALAEVADDVFAATGVRRFDGAACADPDLPNLMRQSWVAFTGNVAGYEQWERNALANLWSRLDPSPKTLSLRAIIGIASRVIASARSRIPRI
jgi:hypothetical protein